MVAYMVVGGRAYVAYLLGKALVCPARGLI